MLEGAEQLFTPPGIARGVDLATAMVGLEAHQSPGTASRGCATSCFRSPRVGPAPTASRPNARAIGDRDARRSAIHRGTRYDAAAPSATAYRLAGLDGATGRGDVELTRRGHLLLPVICGDVERASPTFCAIRQLLEVAGNGCAISTVPPTAAARSQAGRRCCPAGNGPDPDARAGRAGSGEEPSMTDSRWPRRHVELERRRRIHRRPRVVGDVEEVVHPDLSSSGSITRRVSPVSTTSRERPEPRPPRAARASFSLSVATSMQPHAALRRARELLGLEPLAVDHRDRLHPCARSQRTELGAPDSSVFTVWVSPSMSNSTG